MQLARPVFRRRLRLRQHVNETAPSSLRGAKGGLPLFLAGGNRSHARNFGSVTSSLEQKSAEETQITPEEAEEELPGVSGEGVPAHAIAYGLSLQGRTDADFSSSFSTENGQTRPATSCAECAADECIRATGTLVSTFQVATTVTLPSVDDFPNLTPCQRDRVRSAITNVLAPHEQRHVTAFQTYNGTVRRPFNLTLCQSDFEARIQAMHDGIEAPRQAAAQARSDSLDPFNFEVDLNCQDAPGSTGSGGTPRSTDAGQ